LADLVELEDFVGLAGLILLSVKGTIYLANGSIKKIEVENHAIS
jgi:hypothetical protein